MQPNIIERVWRQDKMTDVDVLNGFVFTGEAVAHKFVISGKNVNTPVDISGTVTANFKNADNVLVPLTGTIEDGKAVVVLSPECYAVEGPFSLMIFADTVCIYAAIANVINSSGEVIAYPTASIPSVQELIEEVQDVIASIPQDYSTLNQSVQDLKSAFVKKNLYLVEDSAIASSGDTTITFSVEKNSPLTYYVEVKNGSSGAGWFNVFAYNGSNQIFNQNQAINAGGSAVYVLPLGTKITSAKVENINARSNCIISVYGDMNTPLEALAQGNIIKRLETVEDETSGLIVFPKLRNGSIGNKSNTAAVACNIIYPFHASKVKIYVKRALKADGNYYKINYSTYDISTGETNTGNNDSHRITADKSVYYDAPTVIDNSDGSVGFAFGIVEYNSNNQLVNNRITDFEDGDIVVMYDYDEDIDVEVPDKYGTAKLVALYHEDISTFGEYTKSLPSIIEKNGKYKFIRLKNNGSVAGYFVITLKNSNAATVWSTSVSVLVAAGAEYTARVGDLQIASITVNNVNSITHTMSIEQYETTGRPKVFVGPNRSITSFYDGLELAMDYGDTDLYVDSGEYDIIAEIGVDKIMENLNAGGYGPRIGHNIRVYFASDSKVIAHYTGSEEYFLSRFAPLNSIETDIPGASDYEIHGGFISCSRVRYCVHDEGNGHGQGVHVFDNVSMYLDNTNNEEWHSKSCIGGGIGQYTTVLVDGGIYESEGAAIDDGVIYYHNTVNANQDTAYARIIIRNVYFKTGHCQVNPGGTGTKKSEFVVTNCSMQSAPSIAGGSGNFVLYAWNNEIRQ